MVSTRGVKFKFSEGEKVLCYEPDSSKAKVLYDSKVLDLVVEKDSRGRKIAEYLIHFSGWNSSWDRCVAEEFILPDTPENRRLQKRLAEEAAQKLLQTSRSKRRKVPAILKESLNKKLSESSRKDKSESSSPGEESSSDSESPEEDEDDEADEERNSEEEEEEEEEEIAKEFPLEIPKVLRERLEDDCYFITCKKKLVQLPCKPNVVDILESYLKHYATRLSLATCRTNKNGGTRQPPLQPAQAEARFGLCKEAMDGLRIIFTYMLANSLLYGVEQKQHQLVVSTCRPVGVSQAGFKTNEEVAQLASNCQEATVGSTTAVKHRSRKQLQNGSEPVAASPPSRRRLSGSPPERRSLRSSDRHTCGSLSPSKSVHDESDSDNLPLALSIKGATQRQRTTSVCSATSSTSTVQADIPPGIIDLLDCKLLPKEFVQEFPSSPALLYGAQHFLRLFVKLPDLLEKMNLSKKKAEPLQAFLTGLLNYLAAEQEQLFPSSAYCDGESILAQLEKCTSA